MCYVYIKIGMKFSASEFVTLFFETPLCCYHFLSIKSFSTPVTVTQAECVLSIPCIFVTCLLPNYHGLKIIDTNYKCRVLC